MFQDMLDDYRELADENEILKEEIENLKSKLILKNMENYILKKKVEKCKNTIKAYEDYLYNQ